MANQIQARRNLRRLIDGYSYTVHKISNNVSYLRCSERYRRCAGKGRSHIDGGGLQVFELTHHHLHPPNLHLEDDLAFINLLFQACRCQFRSPRVIYDDIAQRFPDSVLSVPFNGIYHDLHRWQRQGHAILPNPTSLSHFNDIMNSAEYLSRRVHDSGRTWIRSTYHRRQASTSILYGDLDFINRLRNIDNLHFLTTSAKVPNNIGACEVITVVVNCNDYAFPCLWVLLPNRLRTTYDDMISELLTFFRINNNPRSIFMDFERRLHGSLKASFLESTIQTTFHSYCVALLMEADLQGLIPFQNNVTIVIQQLMALSCLPANNIQEMFAEVRNSVSPAVRATVAQFFNYYENSWINGVTPENFSYYEKLEALTDCGVVNQTMFAQDLNYNVDIWSFHQQILKTCNQSTKDIERLGNHGRINVTPRVRTLINRDQVKRAWKLFATGKITASRLLQLMTVLVADNLNNLLHRHDWMAVELDLINANELQENAEFEDYEYLLDDGAEDNDEEAEENNVAE
ncbi:uncharacterized protein LOC123271854 [Cotesia glomerata]|uniref:uncharacterized protein LOC123271854 n=1 Tax=Cotesia glomerata TaxID=32391 RepID=UPI001D0276FC|nr:uncharacterized protein LOC123271854 [Cotesia glomerata]